jgi:hypothetical protein
LDLLDLWTGSAVLYRDHDLIRKASKLGTFVDR